MALTAYMKVEGKSQGEIKGDCPQGGDKKDFGARRADCRAHDNAAGGQRPSGRAQSERADACLKCKDAVAYGAKLGRAGGARAPRYCCRRKAGCEQGRKHQ